MAAQSGAHSEYVCACDAGLGELEIDGRGIFKGDCRFPARRLSNPGAPCARSLSASHARRVGKPGHIVSPLVIEIAIQEDGWKQAEFEWRAGSEPLGDLPRALIFLVGIEAHEVKVQLIGVDLGEEVSPASKVF